jgi:hypothetical protein
MRVSRSILTAILALAVVMTPLTAQTRAAVASSTQPRPLATRAMGYPASVQPVGRPGAPRPAIPIAHPLWMAAPVVVVPVPVAPTGRVMVLGAGGGNTRIAWRRHSSDAEAEPAGTAGIHERDPAAADPRRPRRPGSDRLPV